MYWSSALGAVDGLTDQSVLVPNFQSSRGCWESFIDASEITTPLLVTSPDKEQFWSGQSQQLYDALPGTKELARFTTAQGADWHCKPLGRRQVDQRVFDWFATQLSPDAG